MNPNDDVEAWARLDRATLVMRAFRLDVRGMGRFRRGESTDPDNPISNLQPGPIRAWRRVVLAHAKQAAVAVLLRAAPVLAIRARISVAQVLKPVVGWVAVDVVNEAIWPLAVGEHPNETVRSDRLPAKLDVDATTFVALRSGFPPCADLGRGVANPIDLPMLANRKRRPERLRRHLSHMPFHDIYSYE